MASEKGTLYCSFCGKSQHEVRKLIAGPTVFICDECVDLCTDILRREGPSNVSQLAESEDRERASKALDLLVPGNASLKRSVIVEAASMLRIAEHRAAARVRTLYVGPEGCGIADVLRHAWELTGRAVLIEDAVRFRATSLFERESMLARLLSQCDFNVERAQRSVIIIENLDRLAKTGDAKSSEDSRRLQEELETLLRGIPVGIAPQGGLKQHQQLLTVDTSAISFIGITTLLHRGQPPVLGEGKAVIRSPNDLRGELQARGLLRELVDAFDDVRGYEPIRRAEMLAYLREPGSAIWKEWRELVRTAAAPDPDGVHELICDEVMRRGGGMRSLRGLIHTIAIRMNLHAVAGDAQALTLEWLREAM